jgi:hypothetical protein
MMDQPNSTDTIRRAQRLIDSLRPGGEVEKTSPPLEKGKIVQMNVGRFRSKGVAELASYLEAFFNILQAISTQRGAQLCGPLSMRFNVTSDAAESETRTVP